MVEVYRLTRRDERERRPNIRIVTLLSMFPDVTEITEEVTAIHHYKPT